jgi:hypothetical protein
VLGGEGHLAHQVGGDEDGPPLGGEPPEQRPDPADPLGVQSVHRLVEDHRGGVAEERGRDAKALAHAEREAAGPAAGGPGQADRLDDLVHPGPPDAAGLGERQQVGAGAAAGVDGTGVQQGAHLVQGRGVLAVRPPVDGHRSAGGASSPRISRMVVDFPAPFGPRKPVTMPGRTVKVRPSTASLSPYRLVKPCASIIS